MLGKQSRPKPHGQGQVANIECGNHGGDTYVKKARVKETSWTRCGYVLATTTDKDIVG